MEENRTKNFFVVLIVTVLLSVAFGYILNRFVYFSNSVGTYVIIWVILFFGYFDIYMTIISKAKRLMLLAYGFMAIISPMFLVSGVIEALGVAAFLVLGPFEYLFHFSFLWDKHNDWIERAVDAM